MSEREMLERAAAAAGYVIEYWAQDDYPVVRDGDRKYGWNPRVFDSDALRLAVRLCIDVKPPRTEDDCAQARLLDRHEGFFESQRGSDPYAATRLAITRAAAALAPTAQGE